MSVKTSPRMSPRAAPRINLSITLEDLGARQITEMEYAAYGKEEFSPEVHKKLMQRMFHSLDPLGHDTISVGHLDTLLGRMGDDVSDEMRKELGLKMFPPGATSCTFEKFYAAWGEITLSKGAAKKFALVSGNFTSPYQQQQLLTRVTGEKYTTDYRVSYYFKNLETDEEKQVSPWHDVPLYLKDIVRTESVNRADNRYNFVCEIPKWTRAKFEIATKEAYNPIKQDIKNGLPRFYKHGDMLFNYGAFPQTWESPDHTWPGLSAYGDNDPMDAIEIGMRQLELGSVTQVKVLGVLGMIDAGEMDWKVIVISITDPAARFLEDICDVYTHLPGLLEALREWLRTYKICQDGKPNEFAFQGEYKDSAFAKKVIYESHLMWCNLNKIKGTTSLS